MAVPDRSLLKVHVAVLNSESSLQISCKDPLEISAEEREHSQAPGHGSSSNPRAETGPGWKPSQQKQPISFGVTSDASNTGSGNVMNEAGFLETAVGGIPIKKKNDSYQKNINSYQKKIPPTPLLLVCWFCGRLVLWSLCPWSLGPLVPWSSGPLVLLVLWSFVLVFGSLGLYFRGKMRSRSR